MLYISRRVAIRTYGVVDTDDNVEETIEDSVIADLVRGGLDIVGVEVYDSNSFRVQPHQPFSTYTPLQVKLKSLLGVDIHIYKDEITCIKANPAITKTGTRIRLSDLAKRMQWGCITVFDPFYGDHIQYIILVLDDNFEMFGDMTWYSRRQAVFDIREVTNEKSVKAIYFDLIGKQIPPQEWRSCIIDTEERMQRFLSIYDDFL